MLVPCTGAAGQLGCSCFPPSHLAALVLLPGFLQENSSQTRGARPFPKQKIATSSPNGVYFQCRSVIMEGGNGTGETESNFPPQGNRNYKQRGLVLSSKLERGPCTLQVKACQGAAANSPSHQAILLAALLR